MLTAAIMTLTGLVQLVPAVRSRWPRLHRWSGRVFLALAALLALGGLWLVWVRGSYLTLTGAISISMDGGRTWSPRIPTIVNSPHGPIQLRDGRLLYAGKQLWTKERKIGVGVSSDDGLTWQWLAEIPARQGDNVSSYHELHAVEAANGTIVAQIRNHNDADKGATLQTESTDGGRTWSAPHPICYGFPSHLLRLRDGRLLMSLAIAGRRMETGRESAPTTARRGVTKG